MANGTSKSLLVPMVMAACVGLCTPAMSGEPEFLRGDVNGDGSVNAIVDSVFLLFYQFLDGPAPPCLDAADVDDDGTINGLADALFLLGWGHMPGASPPPAPGPFDCGPDPTRDPLGCEVAPFCL